MATLGNPTLSDVDQLDRLVGTISDYATPLRRIFEATTAWDDEMPSVLLRVGENLDQSIEQIRALRDSFWHRNAAGAENKVIDHSCGSPKSLNYWSPRGLRSIDFEAAEFYLSI